jgi:hypothetical protein
MDYFVEKKIPKQITETDKILWVYQFFKFKKGAIFYVLGLF